MKEGALGVIDRYFRLTNEPGGMGLSCTTSGLSLAGVPLLRKSEAGFAPRPAEEIEALVEAAYGPDASAADLLPGFDAVAGALNRGELAHAMIAAVLTRLPELSWDAAARLANAEDELRKYNPFEPRDWHGCWTDDGGADASGQDKLPEHPVDFGPEDDDHEPPDDRPPLERKYDDLGPVEFSKQVIQFGDRLEREGKNFSPDEKQDALAEYNFLQSRFSFWLGYGNKPYEAQGNLISAALTLYEGAVIGGIVPIGGKHGGIPQSMLVAAVGAMALDDSQPGLPVRTRSAGTAYEPESAPSEGRSPPEGTGTNVEELTPSERLGDVVDNAEVGIDWNHGIEDKGLPLESYLVAANPNARRLKPGSKAFDSFDDESGEATSAKVLDPLNYGYINKPQSIYYKVKMYVDTTANYDKQRAWFDLMPVASQAVV